MRICILNCLTEIKKETSFAAVYWDVSSLDCQDRRDPEPGVLVCVRQEAGRQLKTHLSSVVLVLTFTDGRPPVETQDLQ